MDEIKDDLKKLRERLEKIKGSIDPDSLRTHIRELEAQTLKEGFWNDQEKARSVSQQLSEKQKTLQLIESLEKRVGDSFEVTDEPSMEQDLKKEVEQISTLLD